MMKLANICTIIYILSKMNTKHLFKYVVSFPFIAKEKLNVSNDINSVLWLVLLTELTELKVMVPTATVTVTHHIYMPR